MEGRFSITVDTQRSLVRITLAGFFDAAHERLRCGPHEHLTCIDVSAMIIQSQEMVEAFRRLLSDPAYTSRRLAFVVARSLARMQLKRAAQARDAGYFASVAEAEAWLLEEDGAA